MLRTCLNFHRQNIACSSADVLNPPALGSLRERVRCDLSVPDSWYVIVVPGGSG